MRVITGKAKGRRLKSVPGSGTRPITDRAKSALFDILSYDVADTRFLDLFAGTGGVGIEALSRGADEVVFVEKSGVAVRTIYENLEHTQLTKGAQVERADVFKYLEGSAVPFDYIYVAPPQYKGLWSDTLRLIDRQPDWLRESGWVIVQIHPKEIKPLPLRHLVLTDQRDYGSTRLCFYEP